MGKRYLNLTLLITASLLLMAGVSYANDNNTKASKESCTWTSYVNPNDVTAAVEFNDRLVIGTNGSGLVIRNKNNLQPETVYTSHNSPYLPDNAIEGLQKLGDRLFIVTAKGYCWYDGGKIIPDPNLEASPYLKLAALNNHEKYFDGSIYLPDQINDQSTIVKIDPSLEISRIEPGLAIRDFTFQSDGRLLLLSDDGIYREENNHFKKILELPAENKAKEEGNFLRYASIFYDSGNDAIWYSYRQEKMEELSPPASFYPYYLVKQADGKATKYDLGKGTYPEKAFFVDDKAIFVLEKRLSLDTTGADIMVIENGNQRFLGAGRGHFIGKVDRGLWYSYFYPYSTSKLVLLDFNLQPVKEKEIQGLTTVGDNSILVFTDHKVYRISDSEEQSISHAYLPFNNAYKIENVGNNTVYLTGHFAEPCSQEMNGTKFVFNNDDRNGGLSADKYLAKEPALIDNRGNKWFEGVEAGKWYCLAPDGTEQVYSRDQMPGTPFYDFYDLAEDPQGNIWFMSSEGLTKMNPQGEFSYFVGREIFGEQLSQADGDYQSAPFFEELEIDEQGNLWVYTNTLGLISFNKQVEVNKIYGPERWPLYAFFLDRSGNKWVVNQGKDHVNCTILDRNNNVVTEHKTAGFMADFEHAKYYYDSVGKAHFIALSTFDRDKERFGIIKVEEDGVFDIYRNQLDFEYSGGEMFTEMYREQGYVWFVTPAGIVRYDGAQFLTINYEGEGLIGHDSYVESPNKVWVLTTTGIARVNF